MITADSTSDLLHVLCISTGSPQACLEAVASVVGPCGGSMRGFTLKPSGSRFEAVLRLSGIDEAAAWRVAGAISAWPEAGSAHIEHQMLAR
jgi:hypothetical protein